MEYNWNICMVFSILICNEVSGVALDVLGLKLSTLNFFYFFYFFYFSTFPRLQIYIK